MSKIRKWFKQKFCTHYHETHNGMPLFDLYPRRTTIAYRYYRDAKHDLEAVTCLGCGLKYFVTDGNGLLI